jgi:hypothetical protein
MELVKFLPSCIQNKIFYFITLHPVAIEFIKEYNHYKYFVNTNLVNSYNKIYIPANIFRPAEIITCDITENFLILKEILKNKKDKNSLTYSRECADCGYRVIFNNVDIFCESCIREIKRKYRLIVPPKRTKLLNSSERNNYLEWRHTRGNYYYNFVGRKLMRTNTKMYTLV